MSGKCQECQGNTVKSHNLQHGLNLQHVRLFTFSRRPLLRFPSFFQEPFETMSHTILSKNEDRRINSSEEEKEKQEKITWHQKTHTAGRFTTFQYAIFMTSERRGLTTCCVKIRSLYSSSFFQNLLLKFNYCIIEKRTVFHIIIPIINVYMSTQWTIENCVTKEKCHLIIAFTWKCFTNEIKRKAVNAKLIRQSQVEYEKKFSNTWFRDPGGFVHIFF